jgi:DNA-binding CsgD family transcriptional regulator
MSTVNRLRSSLLVEMAQCLMRLAEAQSTAAVVDALVGLFQTLPIAWHTMDVFSESRIRRRISSFRCPRGFGPFVSRLGFAKRPDGTYPGSYAESTLILVKAGVPSEGGYCLICAIGLPKNSTLNDGAITSCLGALIHEGLARMLSIESQSRRLAALGDVTDVADACITVFDGHGNLVERWPQTTPVAPGLFTLAVERAARRRPHTSALAGVNLADCVEDVRARWIVIDSVLQSRYLVVLTKVRPGVEAPILGDRLKIYGLSRREAEVAALVFAGKSNRLIADTLFISRDTVKTHCRRIFSKLGISRRMEFLGLLADRHSETPESPQGQVL